MWITDIPLHTANADYRPSYYSLLMAIVYMFYITLILDPIKQSWQIEDFKRICSSFDGFCDLLGLRRVGPYM
jgi:hypothetical protein